MYDSMDCAQLLLTAGADPDRRSGSDRDKRQTPLHIAAREGKCALVRLLLCYGADIEIEDAEGRNVVDLAEAYGHLEAQQVRREKQMEPVLEALHCLNYYSSCYSFLISPHRRYWKSSPLV